MSNAVPKVFIDACKKSKKAAMMVIQMSFEENAYYLNNLSYHNRIHTQEVINTCRTLLEELKRDNSELISERDIMLAEIAAAFHDIIQDWRPKVIQNGELEIVSRVRYIPEVIENEKASADFAVTYLNDINKKEGKSIFSNEDIGQVREAIEATFSYFSPDEGTFIRPNISEKTSILARIVAFADLNKAGLDPVGSLHDGDKYFKEINLDMLRFIHENHELSQSHDIFFKERIVKWTKDQIPFIQGRMRLLEVELNGAPKELVYLVQSKFNRSEQAIQVAMEAYDSRNKQTGHELMRELEYFT